ncbi:MAG: cytochrome-c peroxidase [Cryomorphaceae bacterium]|nr:cytochrome-c peroxidase [Cryomorphaceae bacterium]
MNKKWQTSIIIVLTTTALTFSCEQKQEGESSEKKEVKAELSAEDLDLLKQAKKFFKPLPEIAEPTDYKMNDDMVSLGKKLYFDTRLSKSNTISCNSCHNLASYGVDNNPTSIGHKWVAGPRNSPTVLNAAIHSFQFWDGRAADVEEQAEGPILNPIEMGAPHEEFVIDRLRTIETYGDLFAAAFPEEETPLTYKNMARAIGAFERTLMTPDRFDDFLKGDGSALTTAEKKGLKTFMDVGCTTCHSGPALGGQIFQKFGLIKGPYWDYTGSETIDEGKYEVTGIESDKYMFKVPGLRNIAKTAPYFHDGSIWDLDKSVEIMGVTQLGKELSPEQIQEIVDFLEALTGDLPDEARTLPILPRMGRETTKPDFS